MAESGAVSLTVISTLVKAMGIARVVVHDGGRTVNNLMDNYGGLQVYSLLLLANQWLK